MLQYEITDREGTRWEVCGQPINQHFSIRERDGEFIIDHTPTGCRAGATRTREAAVSFIVDISKLAKWGYDDPKTNIPMRAREYARYVQRCFTDHERPKRFAPWWKKHGLDIARSTQDD